MTLLLVGAAIMFFGVLLGASIACVGKPNKESE